MAITLDGTNGGTASAGWYGKAPFTGTYTDGIVVDYTTGMGRISVGSADGVTIYNGGVAGTALSSWDASGNLTNTGNVALGSYSTTSVITVKGSSGLTESVGITFGFQSSPSYGGIYVDAPTDTMRFKVLTSEKMRLDSSGNLLVGTTNTDPAGNNVTGAAIRSGAACSIQNGSSTALALGSSANNTYLQVFRNAGTLAGYISVPTANTTTYNSVSDQRLKENIVDAPSALGSINAIKVRSFDWKSDGLHVDYGWIAQELLEVAPEAVSSSDDPDQMMGVDFGRLTPRLVKAIQELSARLEALEPK